MALTSSNTSVVQPFMSTVDQTDYEMEQLLLDRDGYLGNLPLSYKILATTLHTLIFCAGVVGNILLIVVVYKDKSLQTPTYSYLVSLAFADLIVLLSAVPEAILVLHIGNRWISGQVGCSVFVFAYFLGINAGSLNILAFTLEQYAMFCGQKTWMEKFSSNPKTVVISLWIFSILYCSPWFGLTEVQPNFDFSSVEEGFSCELRLSRELYWGLLGADFLLFYVFPLLVAVVCYSRIARLLLIRRNVVSWNNRRRENLQEDPQNLHINTTSEIQFREEQIGNLQPEMAIPRKQVLRMLITIVVLFGVAWLPFRGLLIYNSFAKEVWLNLWFLLFAKTLIYFNSAMNPFLYNAMSPRFRLAVRRLLTKRKGNSPNGSLTYQTCQAPQKRSLLLGNSLDR